MEVDEIAEAFGKRVTTYGDRFDERDVETASWLSH